MRGVAHSTFTMSDGIRLHVATAGAIAGPVIVLLHGFPDAWWGWSLQIELLAAAGFRVIAPDLRGYAQSDAPQKIDAFRLDRLVADVLTVAGEGQFHLVGHDWGGIIAWAVAARHGARVRRVTILNAPHLDVVGQVMRRHPRQLLRSAYVGLFQLSGLAEMLLRAHDFVLLERMIRAVARPDTFSQAALARYRCEWSRPGRLTAMLNYYRALVRLRQRRLGVIQVPTQIVWGMRDGALGFELAQASLRQCRDGFLLPLTDASHWPQLDEADAVGQALISWHRGDDWRDDRRDGR